MSKFTIRELILLMRSCGGDDSSVDLYDDIEDTSFDELGYDSLALLEITANVQRQFGVAIPEVDLTELKTPRQYVDYVGANMTVS